MTAADYIATHDRDYRAWLWQATCYGLPTDDASFIEWREALEAKERDRMRAMMAA